MSKKFPSEFKQAWGKAGIKAAFVSDEPPDIVNNCDNCGGRGFMSTFLAFNGPFQSPSSSMADVNHYDTEAKAWWVGQSYTAPCPVCKGTNGHK